MYILTLSTPKPGSEWILKLDGELNTCRLSKIRQALDYLIQPGNFRGESGPDWISETILINQRQALSSNSISLVTERAMAEGILIESPPFKRFGSCYFFFSKRKLCSKLMHKKLRIPAPRFIRRHSKFLESQLSANGGN